MPSILDEIVAHKRTELASVDRAHILTLPTPACPTPFRLVQILTKRTHAAPALILEVKPSSPSAGVLQAQPDIPAIVSVYNHFAVGISVLADKTYFGGSLDLVQSVASQTPHPVLCKEFVIDPIQVAMARLAGAEAVLLIVKILDDETLAALHQAILDLGMTPVVEIQNEAELARALPLAPKVLLINNRNLETMAIDLETTVRLAPQIPRDIAVVSASGLSQRGDFERLGSFCHGFLVGSALMKESPETMAQILRAWTQP